MGCAQKKRVVFPSSNRMTSVWSKDLMFKNSRSNLYLIVDKTIVHIIAQKLVGEI